MGVIKIVVFRIDTDPRGNHHIVSYFYISGTTDVGIRADTGVISDLQTFPWFSPIEISRSYDSIASHGNLISKGNASSGKTVDLTVILGDKAFTHRKIMHLSKRDSFANHQNPTGRFKKKPLQCYP